MVTLLLQKMGLPRWSRFIIMTLLLALLVVSLIYIVYPWVQVELFPVEQGISDVTIGDSYE